MQLYLSFEGYYQMRMATDPDPTDEPRVGVTVRRATLFDEEKLVYTEAPEYLGARVSFVKAQLVERNGIIIRNDFFVLDPVRVQVRKKRGTLVLDREDYLDPNNPALSVAQANSEQLQRRQPTGATTNSVEVAKATGLPDASNESCINNRRIRQRNLEELRKRTKNPVERAALDTRISQLDILRQWWNLSQSVDGVKPIDRRAHQLTLQFFGWNVDINGKVYENKINADENAHWPLNFWMGGWDGDALCAYISGYLSIPLQQ
jgi:hypothetical protein